MVMTITAIRALRALFEAIKDTAIDVFWGSAHGISDEEQETITADEYTHAFDAACLAMINRMIGDEYFGRKDWISSWTCALGDEYGDEIRKRLIQKEIEGAAE